MYLHIPQTCVITSLIYHYNNSNDDFSFLGNLLLCFLNMLYMPYL